MALTLFDDDDREVPNGEVGEFCVRPTEPYTIFSGYFRAPEATLATFRNLWYHTGDLGRRDADGDYYFVDRKADFIRHKAPQHLLVRSRGGGERTSGSGRLRRLWRRHRGAGNRGGAGDCSRVAVRASVLAPEELARFINENAPYFFVPRYIEFVSDLPRTPTGRIQKFKLRERGSHAGHLGRAAIGFRGTPLSGCVCASERNRCRHATG